MHLNQLYAFDQFQELELISFDIFFQFYYRSFRDLLKSPLPEYLKYRVQTN